MTLPAPPEQVWPWLVQLGKERAGWYLPGWLERAVPRGRRSLRFLDSDFQELAPGDEVPDWGPGEPRFRAVIVDLMPERRQGGLQVFLERKASMVCANRNPHGMGMIIRFRVSEVPGSVFPVRGGAWSTGARLLFQ